MPIITVPLQGYAAGFADRVFEGSHGLLLRCCRARHVENLFLQNGAVQIIHTVAERDLREGQTEADPVRSQVIDVVEISTAHRQVAKLLECGGAFEVGKDSVGLRGLKGKGNETRKTSSLILQLPELA